MKRRKFIQLSSAALLTNFLPVNNMFSQSSGSVVWEVEGTGSDAVKVLFDSIGGIKKLIPKELSRATVLLKPNVCLPHKSKNGTITSHTFIDALCEYLLNQGVKKVIIADHTLQDKKRFKNIELNQVAAKYPKVKLILANEQRYYEHVEVEGKVLKTTETLKLLKKVDLFINLPAAKHHSAANVSLAIKNLMGLVWDRSVFHTELDLAQAIGDLALAIRPQLNIVDASRVLLNGGPTGPGPVITENRLFASTDMLAVDSIVASRYNFGGKSVSPDEIPHLWASYQNGIGEIDLQKIQLEKLKV